MRRHGGIIPEASRTCVSLPRAQMCLTRTVRQMHTSDMDLTAYRKQHGLTLSEMARRLSVAHSTVMRIESGRLKPSAGLMVRIAAATSNAVTPNDLILQRRASDQDAA